MPSEHRYKVTTEEQKNGYRYTTARCADGSKIVVIQSQEKLIEIERTSSAGRIIYVAVDGVNSLVYSNNRSVMANGFVKDIVPLIEGALTCGEWEKLDDKMKELGNNLPQEKVPPTTMDSITRAMMKKKKGETEKAYAARVEKTIAETEALFPQITQIARALHSNPNIAPEVADAMEAALGIGLADGKINPKTERAAICDVLAQAGGSLEICAEGVEIEVAGRSFTLTPPPSSPKGEVVRKR